MSMILSLTALSDENLDKVSHDPPLIWKVLAPDDPEVYENARRDSMRRNWVGRLFSPPHTIETLSEDGQGPSTDLDVAWHGIHYLLTKATAALPVQLSFLVQGGSQVGNTPARAFLARETASIYEALSVVSDAHLAECFDAADMMAKDIYPKIWDRPRDDGVEPLAFLLEYVGVLRAFLSATARMGFGMVLIIH